MGISGRSGLAAFVFMLGLLGFLLDSPRCYASSAGKWQCVDESVVEKLATEHGREAHKPLINTDRGDLLLFVFLLAGALGGFAAGYFWRNLMEKRKDFNNKDTGGV